MTNIKAIPTLYKGTLGSGPGKHILLDRSSGSADWKNFEPPFDELNPNHLALFTPQYQEAVRRSRFHRFTEER